MNVSRMAITGLVLACVWPGIVYGQGQQTEARSANPITRYNARISDATHQLMGQLGVSYKEYQLQTELASFEEQIGVDDALHSLTVARWSAIKTYAVSSKDAQKRAELTQALNVANAAYAQSLYQALQSETQVMSQQWSGLTQARSVAQQTFGQNNAEAQGVFGQTMNAFDGVVRTPDILDCVTEQSGLQPAEAGQAETAFVKSVNQARSNYHAAIDQATAKWRDGVRSESAHAGSAPVEQSGFKKLNREWLTAAQDALDDVRASFKSSMRKYRAQVIE